MDPTDPDLPADGTSGRSAPGALSWFLRELARSPRSGPPTSPSERFRSGDVLGRYELVREIGRGGCGVVFEARDRELGGRVALKTVRPGAPSDAARESLMREVEAGGLRHPNVVRVIEAGRCGDRGPYVVFEHLSGETLAERLARGPLPVAEVIRVAAAVARALGHAHAHGVLHRDLKPANVFLPDAAEAKVIDFGLARLSGGGEGPPGSGTSAYMSPEQRRGGPEDARSDLYALGLLIHEMATGTPRLGRDGSTREAGARASSARAMPPELERLVEALVAPDPAERPGSADDVLERLLRLGRQTVRKRSAPWFARTPACAGA